MTPLETRNISYLSLRVIEECGELVQAICKAERFGWITHHPDRPNTCNKDEVKAEMSDVLESFEELDGWLRHIGYALTYEEKGE